MDLLVAPSPNDNDSYRVIPSRDGETVFSARLTVGDTGKGARPRKFEVRRDDELEARKPGEFVDLARMADRVVAPLTISVKDALELEELLSAYQIDLHKTEVCRLCLLDNQYTPIKDGVKHAGRDGETICLECGKQELRREARYRNVDRTTVNHLEGLLRDVGDVEKLVGLLDASLDPELTKYDEISENVTHPEQISLDELPIAEELKDCLPHDALLPVQSLAVDAGLLEGRDVAVVSATATGKTLVGELAGIQRALEGEGKALFLVPLVALANQKYSDFQDAYGDLLDVTVRVGSNRIYGGGDRYDPGADVVVGTYEGVDHMLRSGHDLGDVGTVVIDEVHNLYDEERGHRVDGLVARLKHAVDAQWIYLSATVGDPGALARDLDAALVEYEERPVPIERHLTFVDGMDKPGVVERLVKREHNTRSSKGYRGQSIVFTNSRRRCNTLASRMDVSAASYHAGLSHGERKKVEQRFQDGEVAAVVTTAALGAGVDFPASQVIFERLAMGIEWLSVQEFTQMLGRAGRPDYHDRGTVWLLAEPGASYHASMERGEDEVAVELLEGGMEEARVGYSDGVAGEEVLANLAAAGSDFRGVTAGMVGDVDVERALSQLRRRGLVRDDEITRLGVVAARHFLSLEEVDEVVGGVEDGASVEEIVTGLFLDDEM